MTRILTVTLNPTLDVSTSTPEITAGPKLRCAPPTLEPGGGGINISRALNQLGGDSTALIPLAGATGRRLADLLEARGVALAIFSAPGETRENLAVTETSSGRQFRFVLPGQDWDDAVTARALAQILHHAPEGGYVVLSGSLPPGVPPDFLRKATAELSRESTILIDTSGHPLADLAKAAVPGLTVLRMDSEEAEDLARRPLPTATDTADFASDLVARGVARQVIVARGADGSVLAEAGRRLHCIPPVVKVNSKVGAGDSFVAGFVLAMLKAEASESALIRGVAAAAAAVTTPANELCNREDAERIAAECRVTEV